MPYKFKIFIGYDYMMSVHSSVSFEKILKKITDLGLNIAVQMICCRPIMSGDVPWFCAPYGVKPLTHT